jgi:hypothetical protein
VLARFYSHLNKTMDNFSGGVTLTSIHTKWKCLSLLQTTSALLCEFRQCSEYNGHDAVQGLGTLQPKQCKPNESKHNMKTNSWQFQRDRVSTGSSMSPAPSETSSSKRLFCSKILRFSIISMSMSSGTRGCDC